VVPLDVETVVLVDTVDQLNNYIYNYINELIWVLFRKQVTFNIHHQQRTRSRVWEKIIVLLLLTQLNTNLIFQIGTASTIKKEWIFYLILILR
jgi:hypothetical protein